MYVCVTIDTDTSKQPINAPFLLELQDYPFLLEHQVYPIARTTFKVESLRLSVCLATRLENQKKE